MSEKKTQNDLDEQFYGAAHALLNADQEKALARRVQQEGPNSPARNIIVEHNIKLLISIGKIFLNRGLSLQDLVGEGAVGVIEAAERFDPDRGTRFSTYASWWIKQAMQRALMKEKIIHIPAYKIEALNKFKTTFNRLRDGSGVEPTVEILAKQLKISMDEVEELLSLRDLNPSSIDNTVEDENYSGHDRIASNADNPLKVAGDNELKVRLRDILEYLDTRTRTIMELRYGLGSEDPMTLKEVGQKVGLTRERVRQIEHQTLARLRSVTLYPELNG